MIVERESTHDINTLSPCTDNQESPTNGSARKGISFQPGVSARGRSHVACTDTEFSVGQCDAARSAASDAALVYCGVVWLWELQHRNVQKVLYLAHIPQSCGLENSGWPIFSSKYSSKMLGNVILQSFDFLLFRLILRENKGPGISHKAEFLFFNQLDSAKFFPTGLWP